MFFQCFSLVFSSNQCGRGGKKDKVPVKKNTIFEQAIPDPDNHKRAHIAPAVDLLVTPYILTPLGKNLSYTSIQSTGSTPSISISCAWNPPLCLRFRLSLFAKKSMRSWSRCNVCVFVFLPNDENQCGRITRNIKKTRPGLTVDVEEKLQKKCKHHETSVRFARLELFCCHQAGLAGQLLCFNNNLYHTLRGVR